MEVAVPGGAGYGAAGYLTYNFHCFKPGISTAWRPNRAFPNL